MSPAKTDPTPVERGPAPLYRADRYWMRVLAAVGMALVLLVVRFYFDSTATSMPSIPTLVAALVFVLVGLLPNIPGDPEPNYSLRALVAAAAGALTWIAFALLGFGRLDTSRVIADRRSSAPPCDSISTVNVRPYPANPYTVLRTTLCWPRHHGVGDFARDSALTGAGRTVTGVP